LLESLAVFTRFGDRVTIAQSERDEFTVAGPYASSVPADETNLVLKARDALRAFRGAAKAGPVAIHLEKNLPVAAGIGGGSSDCAAVLRGLASIWGLDPSDAALTRIGGTLGADLPMCLAARPLVARGTGEILSPVSGFPTLGLVLVNPGVAVSTPAVFSALGRRDNGALPSLPRRLDFPALVDWLRATRNDLEAPAENIEPSIAAARAALAEAGASFVRMSGSGATCFGVFETGNQAKRAAALIRSRRPGWFVAATRSMPSEGTHGPD
jgi:4-diphosphocytidyl-2-C-methyl-D-erythritol kinase